MVQHNGSPTYIGTSKRDLALIDALITINIDKTLPVSNKNDDGTSIDLSTIEKIKRWSIGKAYSNISEYPPSDFNPKIGIYCGIDDLPQSLVPNPEGGIVAGYTLYYPNHDVCSISFTLFDRIKSIYSSSYDITRKITGNGIHELGHVLGIIGDDPNLTHTDPNSANCTMHSGLSPSVLTNPVFCKYHIDELKTFVWYKQ